MRILLGRIMFSGGREEVQNLLYHKASPMPPAPLAVAGFLVAGLVAWYSSDWLAGLLGFGCLVLILLVLSVGMCVGLLVSGC